MTQPGDYAGKIAPHNPDLTDAQRADVDGDGFVSPNPLGGADDLRDRDGLLVDDADRTNRATEGAVPPEELDADGRNIASPRPEENPDIISLEEQNGAAGVGTAGLGAAGTAGVAGAGHDRLADDRAQGACQCAGDCGCDHGAGVCNCAEGPAACTCGNGHDQTHRRDVATDGVAGTAGVGAAGAVAGTDDVYAPNGGYGTEAAPLDRVDDLDSQTTGTLDDGRVNEGAGLADGSDLAGGTGFSPAHSDDVR